MTEEIGWLRKMYSFEKPVPGCTGGCKKSHFKDCLQQLKGNIIFGLIQAILDKFQITIQPRKRRSAFIF